MNLINFYLSLMIFINFFFIIYHNQTIHITHYPTWPFHCNLKMMNFSLLHSNSLHFYFHEFLHFYRMNFDSSFISFFVYNQKVFKFHWRFFHNLTFFFILIFLKVILILIGEYYLPYFVYYTVQFFHCLLKSFNTISKNKYSMVSSLWHYFYFTIWY